MALTHARPGELIDVQPLGGRLAATATQTLVKTPTLEIIRLVLPQGKEIKQHQVPGEITVQCLEGRVKFVTPGATQELTAGSLLYLRGAEPHSVQALENASVLVTILLAGVSPVGD